MQCPEAGLPNYQPEPPPAQLAHKQVAAQHPCSAITFSSTVDPLNCDGNYPLALAHVTKDVVSLIRDTAAGPLRSTHQLRLIASYPISHSKNGLPSTLTKVTVSRHHWPPWRIYLCSPLQGCCSTFSSTCSRPHLGVLLKHLHQVTLGVLALSHQETLF